MRQRSNAYNSVILDVDGVLWIAGASADGAGDLLDNLREVDIPFCLLTNGCRYSRAERHRALAAAGLVMRVDQLVTPGEVTKEWLRLAAIDTIMYLGAPNIVPDIAGEVQIRECSPVDAVVVGDLFAHFDQRLIDSAARAISDGATLVAMQRNAVWSDGKDWFVDIGFWVAGLEFVTGRMAVVIGKPSRCAYVTAMTRLGRLTQDYSCTAFVSDDIAIDLKGAKDVGLTTVYYGSERILPPWVDFSVCDMAGLASILVGNGHD